MVFNQKHHIYKWNIECIQHHPNDLIGITSIEDTESLENASTYIFNHEGGLCLFWWQWVKTVWRGDFQYDAKVLMVDSKRAWKNGDIVTIKLDTERGEVIFYKNEQQVFGAIPLQDKSKEIKWYPFISLGDTKSKYINRV